MANNNKENEKNKFTEVLYKYRSLQNFERIVDIIVNKKLYTSKYDEQNDHMEGFFKCSANNLVSKLHNVNLKKQMKFCSLSKKDNDPLMVAHYCDGAKGIIFGVKINSKSIDCKNIIYNGLYETNDCNIIDENQVKEILTHKIHNWSYEEEVRIFSNVNVNIEIVNVRFCNRINSNHRKLIILLLKKFSPNTIVYDYNQNLSTKS